MPKKPIKTENALARLPLFRGLNRQDIARIAKDVTVVAVPRSAPLFQRGDPSDGIHVVMTGQIKLALPAAHRHERVIELIGPGQTFGEAAMFLGKPHLVAAVALADTQLLQIPKPAVLAELDRNPRFARKVIANLGWRLHQLIGELEAVSLRTGTERVIGYLVNHLPDRGCTNSCTTTLPASKGIIASQLNLTQEHFSRILHDLSAAGLISVTGRKINIPDIEKLLNHRA